MPCRSPGRSTWSRTSGPEPAGHPAGVMRPGADCGCMPGGGAPHTAEEDRMPQDRESTRLDDPAARALFLFPTKALGQDQVAAIGRERGGAVALGGVGAPAQRGLQRRPRGRHRPPARSTPPRGCTSSGPPRDGWGRTHSAGFREPRCACPSPVRDSWRRNRGCRGCCRPRPRVRGCDRAGFPASRAR